jgi:hypothetical protein
MHEAKYVYYNDGVDEDNYALYLGPGEETGKDKLHVFEGKDAGSIVEATHREKSDYDEFGGGKTWHL